MKDPCLTGDEINIKGRVKLLVLWGAVGLKLVLPMSA